MYLVTAATQFEMDPFLADVAGVQVHNLVTGIGPVETAVRLMAFLHDMPSGIDGVVNFGIAGSYVGPKGKPRANLLEICLAEKEVLGDLGICLHDRIEPIRGNGLEVADSFAMNAALLEKAGQALRAESIPYHTGTFVTVNCTTGTGARGSMLAHQHKGLCENMEGAAVARVCQKFSLPCLELRCISNLVEDRDTSQWKLKEACKGAGRTAAVIIRFLMGKSNDE